MLFSILKDGIIPHQDLHTYIDSGYALDSIDHLCLVAIMENFGYPINIVNLIGNIYTKISTIFVGFYFNKTNIPILNRTMQGDNLEPFLYHYSIGENFITMNATSTLFTPRLIPPHSRTT